MKKKHYLMIISIIFLFSISLFYLQHGRKLIVHNSNIYTSKNNTETEINIIANKLYIPNKKAYAQELVEQARSNQLPKIRLSNTTPDKFVINIYKSNYTWGKSKIFFTILYYPKTNRYYYQFIYTTWQNKKITASYFFICIFHYLCI